MTAPRLHVAATLAPDAVLAPEVLRRAYHTPLATAVIAGRRHIVNAPSSDDGTLLSGESSNAS